jgi:hypothetical protein
MSATSKINYGMPSVSKEQAFVSNFERGQDRKNRRLPSAFTPAVVLLA